MVRDTSIEAYHKIKNQGLLSRRRFEVYQVLYDKGPLTASQIAGNMPAPSSRSMGGNVHARLHEMRERGTVKEIDATKCPITGMRVILWDVTSQIPKKVEVKKNRHYWIDPEGGFSVSEVPVKDWTEVREV